MTGSKVGGVFAAMMTTGVKGVHNANDRKTAPKTGVKEITATKADVEKEESAAAESREKDPQTDVVPIDLTSDDKPEPRADSEQQKSVAGSSDPKPKLPPLADPKAAAATFAMLMKKKPKVTLPLTELPLPSSTDCSHNVAGKDRN